MSTNPQPSPKRSGMGGNPLSQSLFSRTDTESATSAVEVIPEEPKQEKKQAPSKAKKLESKNKKIENRFLEDMETSSKESIGLQVTTEINDWLDGVVKAGRRKHGKKIPKQVWIQAGVELLRSMPVEWTEISDLDELRRVLDSLSKAAKEQS